MDTTVNQRQEQRLCYRWPVGFTRGAKEKPSPGQIVDVSSCNMAFLCHADTKCPLPEELITVDFGVPYFDLTDSFDTVFFNRTGRVRRVDKLTNLVNRVVIKFSMPLFFKPGEQNVSESDALQRLEAKAQSISKAEEETRFYSNELLKAREKTKSIEQAKEKAEQKLKDEVKARIKAESRAEAEIQARIEAEKQAKFDIEKITKAHFEELKRFEKQIKVLAEDKDRMEEQLNAEIEARCRAEANLIAQAEQSAKAQEKAKNKVYLREQEKAEIRKRKKLEAQMQQKIKFCDDQIVKIKADAAEEIAKVKADVTNIIAGLKAQLKQNSDLPPLPDTRAVRKIKIKTIPSTKTSLMEKVDKLIKDRGIIY